MKSIDLHTHSSHSDGILSPSELLEKCAAEHLSALALTDHDTMSGVDEAMERGKSLGIEVMGGIEISASQGGRPVHILGYGISANHPEILKLVKRLQKIRTDRNRKIIKNLAGIDIMISEEELRSVSNGLIGRPHFARLLVKRGIVKNLNQAFQHYLKKNGRAYAQAEKYPAGEAIKIINKCNGVSVLAHPGANGRGIEAIRRTLGELRGYGLGGVEVFYPGHPERLCRKLIEFANDSNMLITGGSDYHGFSPPLRPGGKPLIPAISYELFRRLKERISQ